MHSVSPIVSDFSSRQMAASPGFQTPFPHSAVSNAPPVPSFGAMQSIEESPAHYKLSLSAARPNFGFPRYKSDDRTKSFLSIVTGLSGNEGEAVVYGQARMLQDATGRLCELWSGHGLANSAQYTLAIPRRFRFCNSSG
jgi:hypothetical protein